MLTQSEEEFSSLGGGVESGDRRWFAVQTRTRFEKKAVKELQDKQIETFLPLHSRKHRWSDRYRVVRLPLFPSYVFVRIGEEQETRIAVLRTIGVRKFVGGRGAGAPIPDAEIRGLQTVLEQQVPFELYSFLNVGQRVRIRGGCLDGLEGILTAMNGKESLVISVQLVQRSVAVQISGYQVEPIGSASTYRERRTPSSRRDEMLTMRYKENLSQQRSAAASHS